LRVSDNPPMDQGDLPGSNSIASELRRSEVHLEDSVGPSSAQ